MPMHYFSLIQIFSGRQVRMRSLPSSVCVRCVARKLNNVLHMSLQDVLAPQMVY